ncbi:MAG: alpha-amylase family protein [Bacteroidales bacterium]|jgi:glycosidase|nr:alpha-amylase family protein [Bacteroidales bacterium]
MKNSKSEKINVYQVFTRLFGNKNTTNKPWGTIEENGVGKFSDFDSTALAEIRKMGITHMWYTGVPHHDVIRDYTAYGIANDDPDVVKGRAGSPYAVKDYYNVNPDLADDPSRRLEEFEELIARTHANGLKVIIDIVPNHVARNYQSVTNPDQVESFGESDDTSVVYARDNNFYYIPGEDFQVPDFLNGYLPLGGEPNPLSDNKFKESPAKWTGNGSRLAKPGFYDWYETVKINYGVRPDGSKDFEVLPPEYAGKSIQEHAAFWADKSVPDSWIKFRDIALYWIGKGVDGFRYDMAEMVPVEFWSYMNSAIKTQNPDAFLLAEVYNPDLYRDYIFLGKMDYLYDKVALYDTLKNIMQGRGSTDNLVAIQESVADIEHHMLHFLENHDEQRIASVDFAGKAEKGKPAMVVSACISTSPTMLYFGQEVGEPGDGNPGFGSATRTTIFDYWGVPNHQRWMNNGAFDGGQLTEEETNLRVFYVDLLNIVRDHSAFSGKYKEIHRHNRAHTPYYNDRVFSFVRWNDDEKLIVVTNFDAENTFGFSVSLDWDLINEWNLQPGVYELVNLLDDQQAYPMKVDEQGASVRVDLKPLESVILKMP